MRFEDIKLNAALPELVFPVTASAIAVAAIATGDYETVHHDIAAANASGVPNIFMNILTTNGLVQRFVGDWAGPDARISGIKLKLGAPNFAGDTMRLNGSVVRVDADARAVDVAVSGRNGIGEHVAATISLTFPKRTAA